MATVQITANQGVPIDISGVGNEVVVTYPQQTPYTGVQVKSLYEANTPQVSAGEITAGSETAIRVYSPADMVAFIAAHESGGGGAGATKRQVDQTGVAPAGGGLIIGLVNGSNQDYQVARLNFVSGKITVYWKGILQREGVGWQVTNAATGTFRMLFIPSADDWLTVDYIYV